MSVFAARTYRLVFTAAAAYNIAFGFWAAAFPHAFFDLFELAPPRYPAIWACLGMVVGLYGAGYAYAARHLDRAYPFIAIGLAGKVLGPIGWLLAVGTAELPARTFPLIVFDDLIWWLPFSLFLLEGSRLSSFLKRTAPHWCAALHIAGAAGTIALLRGGSEAIADVQLRIGYLGQHPDRWRVGWLLWMLAALSLLAFYAWWGSRVSERPALNAFAIGALGLVCDFAGESIFIGWIPMPETELYRAATLLTGAAGNGFYTIAAITLTLATPKLPLRWLAWLAWSSGIALTIFTLLEIAGGVVVASAVLMITLICWLVSMAMRFR